MCFSPIRNLIQPSISCGNGNILTLRRRRRSRRRFTSSTISSSTSSSTTQLGNILLVASVSKALSRGTLINLDADSIPLSESLVLQVLRRNSLDPSKKLDFFRWCCSLSVSRSLNNNNNNYYYNYKHTPKVYSQIFRVVCSRRAGGLLHEIPNLLTSMKLSGIILDSSTFKLILDTFIRSGKFDSALEILDHLEEDQEQLGIPHVYSSVLVALVRKGQLGLALSIFFKLLQSSSSSSSDHHHHQQQHLNAIAPDPFACNELFVALRRADMRPEFNQVFNQLREKKLFHTVMDTRGYNICIHAFGCWGDLITSLSLFREMKENNVGGSGPDLCTYNTLIQVLCSVGKVKDALIVWEQLKGSGHEPNAFTYGILIQGCSKSYRMDDATKLFSEMQYNGFSPDTVVYNSLLNGLLKARKLADACQLFEKMVDDGVRASCWTHNILIDGLFRNGRAAAGHSLFCDLKKKGQFVDGITYSIIVLHLCREGHLEEALQLVEEMEARGFVVDLVTITTLLIRLHRQGKWEWTDRLMKHIRDGNLVPTVLKWKANMEASMKNPQSKRKDFASMFPSEGDLGEIMNLIHSADSGAESNLASGRPQDEDIFSGDDKWSSSPYMDRLANQVNSMDDFLPLFSLFKGKRVREKGMDSFDIDMVNTFLSIFLAKGKLSLACKLFEIFTDMGVNPESYTYNSIMSSFVKKGYFKEAWGIFHEMGEKLCPADIATYNVIIQGLGKMGRADVASAVLDKLMKQGGYLDTVMYNTLINALGKADRINEANKLFQQMRTSGINADVVTYNTLIEVHSKAGLLKDAYKFLKMMLNDGCSPNHVTDTILDFLEKEIEKLRYQKASIKRSNKDDSS